MTFLKKFSNEEMSYFEHEGIKRKTDRAILFILDGMEIWLPTSQIDYNDEIVGIPTWLVNKKGLI